MAPSKVLARKHHINFVAIFGDCMTGHADIIYRFMIRHITILFCFNHDLLFNIPGAISLQMLLRFLLGKLQTWRNSSLSTNATGKNYPKPWIDTCRLFKIAHDFSDHNDIFFRSLWYLLCSNILWLRLVAFACVLPPPFMVHQSLFQLVVCYFDMYSPRFFCRLSFSDSVWTR